MQNKKAGYLIGITMLALLLGGCHKKDCPPTALPWMPSYKQFYGNITSDSQNVEGATVINMVELLVCYQKGTTVNCIYPKPPVYAQMNDKQVTIIGAFSDGASSYVVTVD